MNRPGGGKGGGPSKDPSKGPFKGPSKSHSLGNDTHGDQIFIPVGGISHPDPAITKREDENVRLPKGAFANTLTQGLVLPRRPGYGEPQFMMHTNYFQMTLNTKKELFKYNVKIDPVSESARSIQNSRKRRQFYKIFFAGQPDFRALGQGIATDYANTLITCGRLYDRSLLTKEYQQVYHSDSEQPSDQSSTAQSIEQRYKVTVEYLGLVASSELTDYINSQPNNPSDFSTGLDAIQAMNIIVAGSPNKNRDVFQAGQNKFFQYPRNTKNETFNKVYGNYDLTNGLIAVRGYYSSVRTSTSRILLNLNAQCSAFYPEINLLELMDIVAGKGAKSPWMLQNLEDFIKKLRVRTEQKTREGQTVSREMAIRGFAHKEEEVNDRNQKPVLNSDGSPKKKGTKGATMDYENSNSITFLDDTHTPHKKISVSKYFLNRYGKPLKSPQEPVVNCGTDESPRWIPPERCTVVPGQPYRGTLNDRQTTNMLTVAARGPSENARRITRDGLTVIGIQPRSPTLDAFGITVNTEMLPVHARKLAAPSVMYYQKSFQPGDADWNLTGKKFFKHVDIRSWSYLNLARDISDEVWGRFETALKECGMGEKRPDPYSGYSAAVSVHGDEESDKAICHELAKAKKRDTLILWVILPSNAAALYARVKFLADVKFGIHTVCVVHGKLKADVKSPTYYANVTHKFNLKLGGINHRVSDKDLGIIQEQATMIVGIDVTHPAPNSMENAPSIVGMVASIDNQFGQWPGSIKIQKGRQEIQKIRKENQERGLKDLPEGQEVMVENVVDLLSERLSLYQNRNGNLPTNILIYRDGVSEGQYQAVLDLELKPIREKCRNLYDQVKQPPPKITVVIVAKRHHTRFYPISKDPKFVDTKHFANQDDKWNNKPLCNPVNGTVVDRGITMQKGWDFYLQSHMALKGTARPTHYVVIHDEIGLGGGKLETITYNLCYHYAIATKAVSICPPAYYADILCERGRCYLSKHLNMRGKPPGTRFDPAQSPWTSGVHQDLRDSMFYL